MSSKNSTFGALLHLNLMNMKKIVTIIALSTSMLSMAQNWDGTAEAWTSGSGSEQDPYILQTAGNIAYLTEQVNNGTTYEGVYFALGQRH